MAIAQVGFQITGSRGFHITFDNGVTVSVQFGGGNYCENYDMEIGSERGYRQLRSKDAEVAVFDVKGEWLTTEAPGADGDDNVMPRKSPAEVLAILDWAAQRKEGNP